MILSLPNSNEVSAIRISPRAAAHVNPHGKRACVKICFANACKPDGSLGWRISASGRAEPATSAASANAYSRPNPAFGQRQLSGDWFQLVASDRILGPLLERRR